MNDQNPYAAPQTRPNDSGQLRSQTASPASLRKFYRTIGFLFLLYSPLGLGLFIVLGNQRLFLLMPVVQLLGMLCLLAIFWWRPLGIGAWWLIGAAFCQTMAMIFAWVCAYLEVTDTLVGANTMGFFALGAQICSAILLQAGSYHFANVFALSSLKYCVRRALIVTGFCLFCSTIVLATDQKNHRLVYDAFAGCASLSMMVAYLFHCLTLFFLWRSEPLVLLQLQRLAPQDFPSLPQAEDAFLTDLSRMEAESSE